MTARVDRGLLAWALGASFFFYAFVLRVSPSVMVEELMRDFNVSAAILGHLSAFYFYAYASIQIPIGVLMDRIGPRRLLSAAAALCALGCWVFATADSVTSAYWGRLMIGAGSAFSWVGTLTVIALWLPPQHFALFTGLAQFAGMAGAIFGQAPLGIGVEQFGWRSVLWVCAGCAALLAVALWAVVRDRPRSDAPRAMTWLCGLRRVAANPQTWLMAAIGLTLTGPVLAFASLWGVPYLSIAYGMERSAAAAMLAVIFVGWALGAPLLGWLSDRIKRRKPLLLLGGSLSTATLLAILYLPDLPLAVMGLLFFLNGAGGASMILTFASAREHNPPEAGGVALGVVNMAVVGSGALFQPLIGWLLDQHWDGRTFAGLRFYSPEVYQAAFVALPLGGALGILLTLLMRETYAQQAHGASP